MPENNYLAQQFEENRGHLRGMAYRMLGSLNEADDAVQEAWLRLSRSDASTIENLGGWLTTVVARVCLDMLRSRTSRREEELQPEMPAPATAVSKAKDPEQETLLADSVGLALLVVLDRLAPAERLAFVLHDMFAVPFDEIASILGHSPESARQLASRARRRVQGAPPPKSNVLEQRKIVNAFLAAVRGGDIAGLIAVLDPDVVVRVDAAAAHPGAAREVRGAATWAKSAIAFSRNVAGSFSAMLIDGDVGLGWAPSGHLARVLRFSFANGKIATVDVIGDPARLRDLAFGVLEE